MPAQKGFDTITFIARFGFGFLFGGIVTVLLTLGADLTIASIIGVFILGGVICGLLTWRYGDRALAFFADLFSWW
ncbi:hypothetical protein [Lyngbya sp. CCY1209]|uniref:hypothetical protein n=1 Tax=Lyngbya sp. CCY1209 TaxID=2886103 RepID=UPI002D20B573|nr:hypothetical protein [Lyngbya sp. CCY1209]MEB3884371.1 hypothetical protein [Lyngbya sp. CCY1209]